MLWDQITAELERDHRVVRYDDRGTGLSERTGPYGIDTGVADMEVVAEAAGGGPTVVLGVMDGVNKAVRLAARRPDLISHVVSAGGAPLSRHAFSDDTSMIASNTVVAAFMQQLEADYRGAVRGLIESTNPRMGLDDVRARVAGQVEHVPAEAAIARVEEWAEDTGAEEPARRLGARLVVLLSADVGAGWFPKPDVLGPLVRRHMPEAVVEEVADGIISRPELTAAVIRERTRADVESPA